MAAPFESGDRASGVSARAMACPDCGHQVSKTGSTSGASKNIWRFRRFPCRLLRLTKRIGLRSHRRLSAVLVKMSRITLTFIRRFKYALENTNFTLLHSDLFRCQLFHNNVCRDSSIRSEEHTSELQSHLKSRM